MKRYFAIFVVLAVLVTTACERVAPNYVGVLMTNFGKNGKEDFSQTLGRVNTMAPGTELFQVPLWEQRADFEDRVLHLKAADNTEFTSRPMYSYEVIQDRAVDLVFQNSQLGSGDKFMRSLENNILESRIYDIMKEESRKFTTEELMANGGSLKFEENIQKLIEKEFESKGIKLLTLSCQLEFSEKVKERIDVRNEVSTNITVLNQQIAEQRLRLQLADLQAQENRIKSSGLTQQLLMEKFIEKWDGKTPLYGSTPINFMKNIQ